MRRSLWVLLVSVVVSVGGLGAAPVSAQAASITVKLEFTEQSPYAGKRVEAKVAVDTTRSQEEQEGLSELTVFERSREGVYEKIQLIRHAKARVAVLGGGRVFTLVIPAASLGLSQPAAPSTSPFLSLALLFQQPTPLHDGRNALPRYNGDSLLVNLLVEGVFESGNPANKFTGVQTYVVGPGTGTWTPTPP
ncbi:MAG: hypothetical protein OEU68_07300 [Nitrospira sp.]|nr:hypothetical protein [Nitrospira sp.]MDH4245039.1 hypothetical protein [Nitrospira sp.]MDH4355956.1 hypothetical protein [Nitrospira sp.]MDH5319370.1 hypothetical protein [Nitrospira sp.]